MEDAATTTATFDLVINGTSAGLTGSGLDVADGVLREAVCYDMMYGPKAVFVTRARSVSRYGAFDGLGMLIEQAAEAFRLWRGVHPDTRQVRTLLGAQVERGR
ncbi:MAG: hypothetical protein R3E84_00595 [Pseudomonadales bacterium]